MQTAEQVLKNIFEIHRTSKVPVQTVFDHIRKHFPYMSTRGLGILVRKIFGKKIQRGKPGKTRNNPRPVYSFYGLRFKSELVAEIVPDQEPDIQPHTPTPEKQTTVTPAETKELRKAVVALTKKVTVLTRRVKLEGIPVCLQLPSNCLKFGDVLGKGTFGTCFSSVYKGIEVAIKQFHNPERLPRERFREEVVREARTILNLEASPHLPLLIGVCVKDEPYCMITQCWGRSMYSALHSKRLLGAVPWVQVIRQVIEGLAAIHRSSFVHNDLKDDNILLREESGYSPQIIDFGKASRVNDSSYKRVHRLSVADQRTWRLRYPWIAPELVASKESPSPSTDVYSMGFVVGCVIRKLQIPILKNVYAATYMEEPAKRASLNYVLDILSQNSN